MSREITYRIAVLVVLSAGSCFRSEPVVSDPLVALESPCVIDGQFGTYCCGKFIIRCWAENHIVCFRVSRDGDVLIDSQDAATGSAYSRWSLFWSGDEELWFYSGDIGLFLWARNESGAYEARIPAWVDDGLLSAPPEFIATLGMGNRRQIDELKQENLELND